MWEKGRNRSPLRKLSKGVEWPFPCCQSRETILHRSQAAALTWSDVELRDNGTGLINIRSSRTCEEGEGITLYIGHQAGEALRVSGLLNP